MEKSTISMAIFNSYVTNYQRVAILLVTACDLKIRRNPDFPGFFLQWISKNITLQ